MDEIIKLSGESYLLAILAHAKLINVDAIKHLYTEGIYESLFDVLHDLAEKEYATDEKRTDGNVVISDLYSKVESLKNALKYAIPMEKDEGRKNQLISKYDDVQQICAKIKSLICEDDDDKPMTMRQRVAGLKPKTGY